MANFIITNPDAQNTFLLDSDRGDRVNRYTEWIVNASSSLAIDEADIVIPFDQTIPDSLKSGQLTTVENDLDNLTKNGVKNFIASGLGIQYFISTGILKGNRAVYVTPATGNMAYPNPAGSTVTGILRSDSTNGQYMRVAVTEGTSCTIELGGSVAEGDYLMSDTTGRAITATSGKKAFGVAPSAGTVNQTKTITLSFSTVA